jgi:murein DD-endopeptidase MepM/ murein hydrolase activator NlpD
MLVLPGYICYTNLNIIPILIFLLLNHSLATIRGYMKNQKRLVLFFVIFLSACSPTNIQAPTLTLPSSPTLSPIPTASRTMTPIPTVNLEGTLFFDYNGSGLRDENEPPIPDYGVCASLPGGKSCVYTDINGRFSFFKAAEQGTRVAVFFQDPNANNPALKFRYLNLWKSAVVIPAYEMNGIIVPEQHLYDTEVIPLEKSVNLTVGEQNPLGLSKGFLTFPFKCGEKFQMGAQYDHDPRQGFILLWNGETKSSGYDPISGHRWSSDNHGGTDLLAAEGTPILATAPGTVNFAAEISGSLHVTLDHLGGLFQTGSGHMNQIAVSFGEKVYRGQIIGYVGHSGTTGNHLHFNFHDLQLPMNPDGSPASLDPWRSIWDSNTISFWTKDNEPQCLP